MKKNILKIAVVVLVFIGSFASCEKPNTTNGETAQLQGTKWKLTGIVDVETGTLQELEPKDCEDCYTLAFDTDSTLLGHSASNMMNGKYTAYYEKHTIYMVYGTATFVGEIGDGYLYVETFPSSPSAVPFSLKENELRLYYNDKKNYLLFKSQQP